MNLEAHIPRPVLLAGSKPRSRALRAEPQVSLVILRWFSWYVRGYLRRHFHSVRVSRTGLPSSCNGRPLIVYLNHASWWDPLACLVVKNEFFPARTAFAPIDAAMLEKYRFFKRLGFFGVEQGSRRGAAAFLREASAVLSGADRMLFVTPQSRFVDVRERPVRFAGGLGHLAARLESAAFLPLALEYVFWEERLPEVLVRFGEPIEIQSRPSSSLDPQNWTALLEQKLVETQDALAREAQHRRASEFRDLLRGEAGVNGVYDLWRAVRARLRGEKFSREHGAA